MPIAQCSNGHYFDDQKYAACPHCAAESSPKKSVDSKTIAMYNADNAEFREETPVRGGRMRIETKSKDEVTVGLFTSKMDADPVVGWLVGLSGFEKGRDHRLHTGRNFIGRSMKMDVSLADDEHISRENHCSILYDPEKVSFYVAPGEGTNTYMNDDLLMKPEILTDGDTIRIGDTELVFAAFCKGDRKWL